MEDTECMLSGECEMSFESRRDQLRAEARSTLSRGKISYDRVEYEACVEQS